jgi:hypothetical protein
MSSLSTAAVININTNAINTGFNCLGVNVGSVSVTATAASFNTSSDVRLKEDLKEVPASEAGRIVDETAVYDFRWKATGERGGYGMIAQQAAQIYATPAFHDEKADRWFIDYSKYVPILVSELKALRAVALSTGMVFSAPKQVYHAI